jgi:LTXXQ motif family protein
MSIRTAAVPALALAVALAGSGLGTLGASRAYAQASTAAPAQQQQPDAHHHRFDPARHVEGRIAYLKAELKITDAQMPQFERVAQAMREDAQERVQLHHQLRADRDKPRSAVERLELRQRFSALRARQSDRFLAAFKPLYASLSDKQKKAADDMFAGHRHHHWRG